jgi:predicted nucleic acid-binding protein
MMVLVDTSVWVLHLREGNVDLEKLLNKGEVTCHRFVVGEIACGLPRTSVTRAFNSFSMAR